MEPEGVRAMVTLDHYIEEVTGPYLTPIVEMYRLDGAPFISNYEKTTFYARNT